MSSFELQRLVNEGTLDERFEVVFESQTGKHLVDEVLRRGETIQGLFLMITTIDFMAMVKLHHIDGQLHLQHHAMGAGNFFDPEEVTAFFGKISAME